MYTLHDDGSTEVLLVHGYFGARPQLRKAVRISVWKLLLARASVHRLEYGFLALMPA
jgi:hypothetical protein